MAGDMEPAIDDLNIAIRIRPDEKYLYNVRALAQKAIGNYELSINDFNKSIELDSKYVGSYIDRGDLFIQMGEFEKAEKDYSYAIKLNPKSALSFKNRGNLYRYLGKNIEATDDFSQAIRLSPRNSILYCYRGISLWMNGKYSKAIEDFNKANKLSPKSFLPKSLLAAIMSTCPDDKYRNGREALQNAEKANGLKSNFLTLDVLSAAYAEINEFDKAVEFQKAAIANAKEYGYTEQIGALKSRLGCYEDRRPWHKVLDYSSIISFDTL